MLVLNFTSFLVSIFEVSFSRFFFSILEILKFSLVLYWVSIQFFDGELGTSRLQAGNFGSSFETKLDLEFEEYCSSFASIFDLFSFSTVVVGLSFG